MNLSNVAEAAERLRDLPVLPDAKIQQARERIGDLMIALTAELVVLESQSPKKERPTSVDNGDPRIVSSLLTIVKQYLTMANDPNDLFGLRAVHAEHIHALCGELNTSPAEALRFIPDVLPQVSSGSANLLLKALDPSRPDTKPSPAPAAEDDDVVLDEEDASPSPAPATEIAKIVTSKTVKRSVKIISEKGIVENMIQFEVELEWSVQDKIWRIKDLEPKLRSLGRHSVAQRALFMCRDADIYSRIGTTFVCRIGTASELPRYGIHHVTGVGPDGITTTVSGSSLFVWTWEALESLSSFIEIKSFTWTSYPLICDFEVTHHTNGARLASEKSFKDGSGYVWDISGSPHSFPPGRDFASYTQVLELTSPALKITRTCAEISKMSA